MTPHKVPHSLLVYATTVSHVAMIGGAIALYLLGKIDGAALAAILGLFGAAWSGVAGALISVRGSTPSADPNTGAPAPGASAAPTVSPAPADGH